MMRADAGLHADPTRRQIGEPGLHLATRPLLPQHDGTALILANDVERVLADIDADYGGRSVEFLRHGVLLVLSAPCQLLVLAGPEQDRAITCGWSDHAIGDRRSVPSSRQAIVSPPDESTYPGGPFCPRRECWPRSGRRR